MHTQDGVAETFINDVKEELVEIMKNPESPVEGKVYDVLILFSCKDSKEVFILIYKLYF